MITVKKIVAALTLVFLCFAPLNPASAHTEIGRTRPAAGSTVAAGVQTVSVEFSDNILNLADSSEIAITDSSGTVVEASCIEVKKTSISAEVFLASEGEYKVVWRTVAEDGHPISGKFSFTATGNADKSTFVSCKDQAAQGNVVIATPKAAPLATNSNQEPPVAGVIWPFLAGGLLILVVGAIVMLRRKSSKA